MLANLAIVFVIAILLSKLFEKIKLPALLGMLITGILLGRYMHDILKNIINENIFNSYLSHFFISPKVLEISTELKTIALIVIIIRAGFGIKKSQLKTVGRSAINMSFIPCIFEGIFIMILAHFILGFSFVEAGLLAFVLAAVSPAVVIPSILGLKEKKYGEDKEIPTLILAGSSIDGILAISIFGAFIDLSRNVSSNFSLTWTILKLPISIITGISAGLIIGYLLLLYFKKHHIDDTRKVLKFMIVAILLYHLQVINVFPIASLIGIMTIGFIILEKNDKLASKLAEKFANLWVIAELILFVIIGAEVNISVIFKAGFSGLIIIFIGLIGRSTGVYLSLIGSKLNFKEKLFCVISYLPKATVQAAIGGIALTLLKAGEISLPGGTNTGQIILAIAVLSIIITAPLGAVGIKLSAPHLLKKGEVYDDE